MHRPERFQFFHICQQVYLGDSESREAGSREWGEGADVT